MNAEQFCRFYNQMNITFIIIFVQMRAFYAFCIIFYEYEHPYNLMHNINIFLWFFSSFSVLERMDAGAGQYTSRIVTLYCLFVPKFD